jgi:hypothetical protein
LDLADFQRAETTEAVPLRDGFFLMMSPYTTKSGIAVMAGTIVCDGRETCDMGG